MSQNFEAKPGLTGGVFLHLILRRRLHLDDSQFSSHPITSSQLAWRVWSANKRFQVALCKQRPDLDLEPLRRR